MEIKKEKNEKENKLTPTMNHRHRVHKGDIVSAFCFGSTAESTQFLHH